MAAPDAEAAPDEKANSNEVETVGKNEQVVDGKGPEGVYPQPSEDPDDPLNWSLPLKVCVTHGGGPKQPSGQSA